jgi:hypothetical protein
MSKNYKVIPFVASVTNKQTTGQVAEQLENIINREASEGWNFESLERIETNVTPIGCFGIKDKTTTNFFQLIVFSK